MSSQDQRHFHRIAYDAPASLEIEGIVRNGRVLDISFKGCLVQLSAPAQLAPGQTGRLTLHLAPGRDIHMQVQIVHHHDRLIGMHCVELDLDSATELRRLVEFNLGDPALLERELHALIQP